METDTPKRPFTVLALAGYAGAGKDTFANAVERHLPDGTKAETIKMADELKEAINVALEYLGLPPVAHTEDRAMKELLRPMMVELGKYARSQDAAIFAKIAAVTLESSYIRHARVAFVTDMRYRNEHEVLSSLCGASGWKYLAFYIECPGTGAANDEEGNSIKDLLSTYSLPIACIERGDLAIFDLAGKDVAAII